MSNLKLSELTQDERELDELVQEVIERRFDHRNPLPAAPEYAIEINERGLVEKGGSLIGVYGLPKTRKSSFIAMVVAAALNENKQHEIIKTPNIKGKILWFDTEMGLHRELPRFHNHIVDMAGRRGEEHDDYLLENYHVINLRPYSHAERLAIIDRILVGSDIYEDVGMMVLDGVADLVGSTNEASESKAVVDRLVMWADKKACPLFVALHLTHSSKKPTGFMGNYLMNKSSYNVIAEVEYDGSPSVIKPGMTRNGQRFSPFVITNVEEGKPNAGRPMFYDAEQDKIDYQPEFTKSRKKQKHVDVDEYF